MPVLKNWERTFPNKPMRRKRIALLVSFGLLLSCTACGQRETERVDTEVETPQETEQADIDTETTQETESVELETEQAVEENGGEETAGYSVETGTGEYKGFVLDNVLHSETEGDIHYNVYIPDDYDGSEPYALFMTLPGYQGLYFQGVGQNVYTEDFGFVAQEYNPKMIIVAPQLEDWGEKSARQTIALTEYFLSAYSIDSSRVYAEGYSGGGETMSLVMGMRPDLYTAYLQCSSQWDGGYDAVVQSRTPVYLVVGEKDEYYGSELSQRAYNEIYKRYQSEGLSGDEINRLLVLDIKDTSYFTSQGITNQHGMGGALFVQDKDIMGWLFGQQK